MSESSHLFSCEPVEERGTRAGEIDTAPARACSDGDDGEPIAGAGGKSIDTETATPDFSQWEKDGSSSTSTIIATAAGRHKPRSIVRLRKGAVSGTQWDPEGFPAEDQSSLCTRRLVKPTGPNAPD
jgi:hypothetical protein